MSDLWTNSTPLSNQDFRKLLSTPRPHDATPRQPQSQRGGKPQQHKAKPSSSSAGGKEHKFKKPAPKGSAKAGADEENDGPQYRDRAEERRKDTNPDYLLSSAELAARTGGSVAGGAVTADSVAGLSIEDSKFLGGDLEHTHLVKGLDYALLHQQRMKLQQAEAEGGTRGMDGPAAAAAARAGIRKEDVKFAGPLGRAVFDALFQPPRRDVRSLFQPRRMAFVYDFDADSEEGGAVFASDVPTTLQRSKADCPPARDTLNATADAVILERIAKIMSYIQVNATGKASGAAGKKAHSASKEKQSEFIRSILAGSDRDVPSGSQVQGQVLVKNQASLAAAHQQEQARQGAAAADDDDDDIFGEAGTNYVPELPERAKGKAETSGRTGSYFDNKDDMADLPPPPPLPHTDAHGEADMENEDTGPYSARQQQQQQQGGSGGGELWRAPRDKGASTKLKGFAEEAYAECFPEIVMGGEVVGSDDEGEVVTDGKKQLGRGDFKTDEEWEAHQAKGVKGAKGEAQQGKGAKGPNRKERRAGAKTVEENKRDQKLDNELGKIEKLFVEKGFGNEGAFAKLAAIEQEGGGGRKGRGGGGRAVQEEATPAPAKRRRMDL